MKLLFDQNLSHKLAQRLSDIFPDPCTSATSVIVSKDADFLALRLVLSGEHARMVWVRLGNGSTTQVEAALRNRREAIDALATDSSQVIEIL